MTEDNTAPNSKLAVEDVSTQPSRPRVKDQVTRRQFLRGGVALVGAEALGGQLAKKKDRALGLDEANAAAYPPAEIIGNSSVETYGANEGLTYDQMNNLYADLNTAYENGENKKEGTKLYQTVFIRESSYKATSNWEQAGYANFEAFAEAHNAELSRMLQNQGVDGSELRRIIVVRRTLKFPEHGKQTNNGIKRESKIQTGRLATGCIPILKSTSR